MSGGFGAGAGLRGFDVTDLVAYLRGRKESSAGAFAMHEDRSRRAAQALQTALHAQAEALGLMAWVGAAMLDHFTRTGSEVAAFLGDEVRRDMQTLGAVATARSSQQMGAVQGSYLGAKLAACTREAEKLARMQAKTCAVTLERMSARRT